MLLPPPPLQEHQGFTPELLAPIDVTEPAQALPVAELPPHTGIGSPEDSLQNCLKLVPKPAKKDPYRWAKLVRWHGRQWQPALSSGASQAAGGNIACNVGIFCQLCLELASLPVAIPPPEPSLLSASLQDNVVLRYEAVLGPAGAAGAQQAQQRLAAIDRERRFVVSFYMADQTLSVYEPVVPNSGLQGGKFLERARVYKNGSKLVRAGRGLGAGLGGRGGLLAGGTGCVLLQAGDCGIDTQGLHALPACMFECQPVPLAELAA
jgi:hypothetical protein